MIKWLFFDLGSTLIDESECQKYRLNELLKQENAPSKEALLKRMKENAAMNRLPYKDTVKELGLQSVKWPKHLEKIYNDTPLVLETLAKKYKLGVIANQSLGTEERLLKYGIGSYFDCIVSSAEAGLSKPDPEIFKLALRKAGCNSDESYMIGDRLDNDIVPAARLGMSTIWVKQGSFAEWNVNAVEFKPDIIVDNIIDILKFL